MACSNKCEADSVRFGGIIQECQYDIVEEKWYKWTCTGGTSCSGGYCRQDYYADSSLCVEKYCEDNPSAPGCADTTYRCMDLPGDGFSSPQAKVWKCTGEDCQVVLTLNGTCKDWGYDCQDSTSCDISDSAKVPCTLSGDGTSTNGYCYYWCGNGKSYQCKSKYSSWAGQGDVYIGQCDEYPSETCAPDLYSPDSAQRENPFNDGGIVPDSISGRDTTGWGGEEGEEPSQIDYWPILDSILDTLTIQLRNLKSQTWSLSSIDSTLSGPIMQHLQRSFDQVDKPQFDLVKDIDNLLKSQRTTLDSLKMIVGDTIDVRTTVPVDTAYKDSTYRFRDSLLHSVDSMHSGFYWLSETVSNLFGDDSARKANKSQCEQLSTTLQSCTENCIQVWNQYQEKCLEGGTPFDGIWNAELGFLGKIFDAIFGDGDSTSDVIDTLPTDTSGAGRLREFLDLVDSLQLDLPNIDSIRNYVDSVSRDTSRIEVNPDSLVLDSGTIASKFSNYYMPGGTTGGCYELRANLGDFGGLLDEPKEIYVDFSNFGGYNFCALGRAAVRIATLVVCISLTLGSFAAAFGWNKNVGE